MLKYERNNLQMATVHGTLEIDDKGVVKGLTQEQEKEFANVPGFEFEEPKKTTKKQSASANKAEPKEEEKKTSTRKSTARKTTTKKSEDK